jgi:hypothetical protein
MMSKDIPRSSGGFISDRTGELDQYFKARQGLPLELDIEDRMTGKVIMIIEMMASV